MAVATGGVALLVVLMTALLPPWTAVHCQRQQVLYSSRRVQVYETSFAGFDWILSGSKWTIKKDPPNPASEMKFDSHEFEVNRWMLVGEWLLVAVLAGVCYFRWTRRLFSRTF
ncbi:MAG: hypothetical protein U0905_21665 [Pirellulales bacterium]